MKQGYWEKEYRNVENLWGYAPSNQLSKYIDLIPKSGMILDIGIGEGRNAIFLAMKGYEVEGIDISNTAIKRCMELSKKYNLRIDAKVDDMRTFDVKPGAYSCIILSNVLNFFTDSDIKDIMTKLRNGLQQNGLIYINVFDEEEPSLTKVKERCHRLADLTFYDEKNNMHLHYFTKEELGSLVVGYETISFVKSNFLDITHGNPHYHSTLEILSRKKEG